VAEAVVEPGATIYGYRRGTGGCSGDGLNQLCFWRHRTILAKEDQYKAWNRSRS